MIKWAGVLAAATALVTAAPAFAANYTWQTIDGPAGSVFDYAFGINNLGQVTGFYYDGTATHGFVEAGGIYTTLDYPVGDGVEPRAINNLGQVAGQIVNTASISGFVETGGVYVSIHAPGAFDFNGTFPRGINDLGDVTGQYSNGTVNEHGFYESAGVYTEISVPGSFDNFPSGINNAGEIVGTYGDTAWPPHYRGFVLSGGVYSTFEVPTASPGTTSASAINNTGQIAGYFADASGYHGFVRTGGGYVTLEDPDAPGSTFAYGINDLGQVVGVINTAGGPKGFLATPVPEPSAWLMLLIGVGGLGAALRRSRAEAT